MNLNQKALLQKAQKIRLLLLDVDGVLTDGRILYNENGREIKVFHVQDGQGIRWLQRWGMEVGFLSGRSSRAVEARAKELGISLLFQGVKDKIKTFEMILKRTKFDQEEVCFMGDDFIDLPLLKRVGLSISVINGHPLVQKEVDYVTRTAGGNGAVREVSEFILKAQGKWGAILGDYGLIRK
ncbi:MAG: HAD-IIIA family hydrolase [Deltaproteobacteria bacterium]|nr:HAD-IIIA family hydrolase [Deltaproteobacteria bacterium]